MTAPAADGPMAALDWRDGAHWSHTSAPCTYCGRLTNLRDDLGRASHKTCAEQPASSAATRAPGVAA